LLLLCAITGYWLYAGKITAGLSDDWTILDPTPWAAASDYVLGAYLHLNGRLASHMTQFFWWSINRIFQFDPESYPWWLILSASLFCIVATPLNIIIAGKRLVGYSRTTGGWLLAGVWAVWTLSDPVYGGSTMATLFYVHIFPAYLLSLGLLWIARPIWGRGVGCNTFQISNMVPGSAGSLSAPMQASRLRSQALSRYLQGIGVRWWLPPALLFLYAALSSEQLLVTVPLLYSLVSLLHMLRQPSPRRWLASLGVWVGLALLAGFIYIAAPGQSARSDVVQAATPHMSLQRVQDWYVQAVQQGYATLFADNPVAVDCRIFYSGCRTEPPPFVVPLHSLLLGLLLVGGIGSGLACYRARHCQRCDRMVLTGLLSKGLFAGGVLLAFHASLSHLLISPYFPPYALTYPSLLLAVGLVAGLLFLGSFMQPSVQQQLRQAWRGQRVTGDDGPATGDKQETPGVVQSHTPLSDTSPPTAPPLLAPLVRLVLPALGLLLVFVLVTLPNIPHMVNAYRLQVWISHIRRQTYQRVMQVHAQTGETHFLLTRCLVDMEAPWGYPAYFGWYGSADIAVVLEGYRDWFTRIDGQDEWHKIACTVPPFAPWPLPMQTPAATAHPVRSISYQNNAGKGVWQSDFWVSPEVDHCTLSGTYHPDIAAHPDRKRSIGYRLAFHNQEETASAQTMRRFAVQPADGTGQAGQADGDGVTFAYVLDGKERQAVPLASFAHEWADRPFVRVTVTTPGLTWLGLYRYHTLRLQCE
jgi:hypothetical protein